MNVLVTGATGYIGGRLVPRLIEAGHAVRCLARDPSRLEGRPWLGIDVVQGDALEGASLDRALAGIGVAYYLIHSLAGGEKGQLSKEEISRRLKDAGGSGFDPQPDLQRMTIPGLWEFGTADDRTPVEESIAVLSRLKATGKKSPSWCTRTPAMDCSMSRPPIRGPRRQ